MKHWHDTSDLKTPASAGSRAASLFPQKRDRTETDKDMLYEKIALSDDAAETADRNLLASVMAQLADSPAPAQAAPAAAPAVSKPKRGISWSLPGFEGECRVATNFGDLPIKALRLRDRVKTLSGAFLEVKWIDQIRLDVDYISRHPEANPVLIRAKALGGVFPVKNMLVSPGQQVWVPKAADGHSMKIAGDMDGQPNVLRMRRPEITYYRFHLGQPEKVCIEGAWFCTAPE